MIDGTLIHTPKPPKASDSSSHRQATRIRFRRRAAIEPIFSHAKHDHRVARNYLKALIKRYSYTNIYFELSYETDCVNIIIFSIKLNVT